MTRQQQLENFECKARQIIFQNEDPIKLMIKIPRIRDLQKNNFAASHFDALKTMSAKTLTNILKMLMVNMEPAIIKYQSDCLKCDSNLPKVASISLVEKHIMNCLEMILI